MTCSVLFCYLKINGTRNPRKRVVGEKYLKKYGLLITTGKFTIISANNKAEMKNAQKEKTLVVVSI